MVGGTYTHLDGMLASQYQSIDWTQHTTCKLQAVFQLGEPFTTYIDRPMVHTLDREPVTQIVRH